MIIKSSPSAKEVLMDRIIDKHFSESRDTSIHASDITHCLTKSYWEKTIKRDAKKKFSEKSIVAMGTGLAWESFITGEISHESKGASWEGIEFNVDDHVKNFPNEIKYTSMKFDPEGDPVKGWPLEWIRRMKLYCLAEDTTMCFLTIVTPYSGIFVKSVLFNPKELENFKEKFILPRRDELKESLEEKKPPEPYQWNDDYECTAYGGCVHLAICQMFLEIDETRKKTVFTDVEFLDR